MKNYLKTKLFPGVRNTTTWTLIFLSVLTVCLVSGCRLFTVGG